MNSRFNTNSHKSSLVLIILVTTFWVITCNESTHHHHETASCSNTGQKQCKNKGETVFMTDSINSIFHELDTDETDYLFIDELIPNVKCNSEIFLSDAEAMERAIKYVNYLDDNCDSVLDIYELRFNLYYIMTNNSYKKFENDTKFLNWIQLFVRESSQKYPFYLVKIYQLFDEDINGKITWKEIRGTIRLAELYNSVKEDDLMDEQGKEDLVASIKIHQEQKWLNLEEFWALLYKLGVDSDVEFYEWTSNYLSGNSELNSELVGESTRKEFNEIDADLNGIITKGELIALLHKHRKNYYTKERENRRWSRVDRNQDGLVTFNEYAFLNNLKHPQRK